TTTGSCLSRFWFRDQRRQPRSRLPYTTLFRSENKILSAQLPLRPPVDGGHIYELRTYRTQVGKAGEWLGHFKTIIDVPAVHGGRSGGHTSELRPPEQPLCRSRLENTKRSTDEC